MHFLADDENFFGHVEFHYEILAKRLRQLSFLNNGIKLVDQRSGKERTVRLRRWRAGFVEYTSTARNLFCVRKFFYSAGEAKVSDTGITIGVEVAMQVERFYQEQVLCFTNNIPQSDGGTHLTGLRRDDPVINRHRPETRSPKAKGRYQGDDAARRPGLRSVG